MSAPVGASRLAESIRDSSSRVVPYLTAGYPDMASFAKHLDALSARSPAVEVGIPFSDPMADGATIQESSRLALEKGATVGRTIEALSATSQETPKIVMSYLNPLVAFGIEPLMSQLAAVGVCGLVIPDLPFEEAEEIRSVANSEGIGLVQMVTPVTDDQRMQNLCRASQGFVYAVTMAGTTGGEVGSDADIATYLARAGERAEVPVLAGFGVRSAAQVRELTRHCDGVVVGSVIIERISNGGDPSELVEELNA